MASAAGSPVSPPPDGREPARIRDAASIVLVRRSGRAPQILMGQRGAGAVFMPEKFVFPGGAVDAEDAELASGAALEPETARRLAIDAAPGLGPALACAAIRELWEETGLRLGAADAAMAARGAPAGWQGFLAAGLRPRTEALRFFFRAVTPPGRPRRFDARFFLAEATALVGSDEDFSGACGELLHLQWLDIAAARRLSLPFVTELVLAEIEQRLAGGEAGERPVPYFHQSAEGPQCRML
ncbi:MAG: NUDIX hydrolase [Rhodobacteraceae bacterium]|nr:NUDIX hydrolase [Paracoccaceae bacterium]MCB1373861.1 NUDIX hydrolase [Paracoccaceae bacterium]MCB1401948.1 NUDIX hydrolase [Paracoccaceae bacterium]MCC0066283.1 NUDIX hydrolase [Rhodovulum sp.]